MSYAILPTFSPSKPQSPIISTYKQTHFITLGKTIHIPLEVVFEKNQKPQKESSRSRKDSNLALKMDALGLNHATNNQPLQLHV